MNDSRKCIDVWLYVFSRSMQPEPLMGSPLERAQSAILEADDAVSSPKTVDAWWALMQEES